MSSSILVEAKRAFLQMKPVEMFFLYNTYKSKNYDVIPKVINLFLKYGVDVSTLDIDEILMIDLRKI